MFHLKNVKSDFFFFLKLLRKKEKCWDRWRAGGRGAGHVFDSTNEGNFCPRGKFLKLLTHLKQFKKTINAH
jgi:hypothetical protein